MPAVTTRIVGLVIILLFLGNIGLLVTGQNVSLYNGYSLPLGVAWSSVSSVVDGTDPAQSSLNIIVPLLPANSTTLTALDKFGIKGMTTSVHEHLVEIAEAGDAQSKTEGAFANAASNPIQGPARLGMFLWDYYQADAINYLKSQYGITVTDQNSFTAAIVGNTQIAIDLDTKYGFGTPITDASGNTIGIEPYAKYWTAAYLARAFMSGVGHNPADIQNNVIRALDEGYDVIVITEALARVYGTTGWGAEDYQMKGFLDPKVYGDNPVIISIRENTFVLMPDGTITFCGTGPCDITTLTNKKISIQRVMGGGSINLIIPQDVVKAAGLSSNDLTFLGDMLKILFDNRYGFQQVRQLLDCQGNPSAACKEVGPLPGISATDWARVEAIIKKLGPALQAYSAKTGFNIAQWTRVPISSALPSWLGDLTFPSPTSAILNAFIFGGVNLDQLGSAQLLKKMATNLFDYLNKYGWLWIGPNGETYSFDVQFGPFLLNYGYTQAQIDALKKKAVDYAKAISHGDYTQAAKLLQEFASATKIYWTDDFGKTVSYTDIWHVIGGMSWDDLVNLYNHLRSIQQNPNQPTYDLYIYVKRFVTMQKTAWYAAQSNKAAGVGDQVCTAAGCYTQQASPTAHYFTCTATGCALVATQSGGSGESVNTTDMPDGTQYLDCTGGSCKLHTATLLPVQFAWAIALPSSVDVQSIFTLSLVTVGSGAQPWPDFQDGMSAVRSLGGAVTYQTNPPSQVQLDVAPVYLDQIGIPLIVSVYWIVALIASVGLIVMNRRLH